MISPLSSKMVSLGMLVEGNVLPGLQDRRFGSVEFKSTERAIKRLKDIAETDRLQGLTGLMPANMLAQREKETKDAHDRVVRLIAELDRVLVAMQQIVTAQRARDLLDRIVAEERMRADEMQALYQRQYKDYMDRLFGEPKKP